MDIKTIDMFEGINIYTKEGGYLSQINAMYVDRQFFGMDGLYINRIIVSEQVRSQGIATQMMTKLVNIADEKRINLLLEINAYGELNEKELKKFYCKFRFIENEMGLHIRKPKILV